MVKKVLVFGSSGMAGHIITKYFREVTNFNIFDVGPRKKVFDETISCDIYNLEEIKKIIDSIVPDVVINCLGVLIKASEQNKRESIWINAYLPRHLSMLCAKGKTRLINLSTDCVFSGNNGPYNEKSNCDGSDFYDRTKALGEIIDGNDLTIRTSIIGPELRIPGSGLFDWAMRQKNEVNGYSKALWSGITTLELAKYIRFLIVNDHYISGLVHYSVPNGISKYELLLTIYRIFNKKNNVISVDKPVLDKRLINTRNDLGMYPEKYDKQLNELKNWIDAHHHMYPQYQEKP